jgi:glycine dehydrogenase
MKGVDAIVRVFSGADHTGPPNTGPANHLRQGYGGPPELYAKAEAGHYARAEADDEERESKYPARLARTSTFLEHPVFNSHHSETEMMRYIRNLERKDIGLGSSMIPLGSCTMKLNAASEMLPVTWPEFSNLHPFAPIEQTAGYQQIIKEIEQALCEITGFSAVSLQPNSGAQGEFAGLMVIRAYHLDRGDRDRDIVLIPASAHGTNPASAAMAGMRVVVIASTKEGNIDVDDLRAKAHEHKARVGADGDSSARRTASRGEHPGYLRDRSRVRRPGSYGRREHERAGGIDEPCRHRADVCHLNLHKTFAIPHGGGDPAWGRLLLPHISCHICPVIRS